MKRHRIILQLESELAQVRAAIADSGGPERFDNSTFTDGYWYGREVGLIGALAFLRDGGEQ